MRAALLRPAAFVCLVLAAALASCKEKKKAEPDDLRQGMEYFKAGLFGQATLSFSAHLRRNPTDADAFAQRGIARRAYGDIEGAFADFDCALGLEPGFVDVYVQRGLLRRAKGDAKGAIEDFGKAIEFDEQNALAYYYRANLLTDTGDLEGAIADYTSALQFEPANALHHFNRGIAHYLRKDWESARADFEAAARQRDPQPYGWLYAHVLRVRLGKGDQARAELRAAVEQIRDSKPGDWFLALAGFLLGDIDEAGLLAAAGQGGTSKARDQRCEAWYFAGMARLSAGQRAEAAECFRQGLATRKTNFAEHSFAKAELEALEARPAPAPAPAPARPTVARPVRGRLSAVGKRSFSMRDRETGSLRSFAVTRDTKVTLNGESASLARLKAAMEAEVIVDANGAARAIVAKGRK
jgi:lipoprotein NlpI